jgi:hypothetical protein
VLTVYIGYDAREQVAFDVCVASLLRHASKPVNVVPLRIDKLNRQGLITREVTKQGGQMFDVVSNAPQSTEFATSRFLSLLLHQQGWAIFVDCDVIFLGDVYEIESELNPNKAIYCVKHEHAPKPGTKMDGQAQIPYPRKNWSSFFAFNARHASNMALTLEMINTKAGRDLHAFFWLSDDEIGGLGNQWNWLVGVQPKPNTPIVAHYTLGGPWFDGWQDAEYDDLWNYEHYLWQSRR